MKTEQVYFYSEPYKNGPKWAVAKKGCISQAIVETFTFHTQNQAWEYLRTVNVYVNGQKVLQAVTEE